ncbi:MAG: crossover junction endodeoxyribonuclease RuvC [bacterium]|nr:crossover junction endodeoxyribonuclease RuvC [bacterium]
MDPGVRKLGYALINPDLSIVDSGILLQSQKSPSRIDQFNRMIQISEFFSQLFKQYPISIISMEQLFFTKFNQNNAEFVYGVRAILLTMALQHQAQIKEFTPIELKKYITGNAKADKLLVQKMIMKIYKLQELPEYNDAADALGLAYLANR